METQSYSNQQLHIEALYRMTAALMGQSLAKQGHVSVMHDSQLRPEPFQ